jgi:hypothetical protein
MSSSCPLIKCQSCDDYSFARSDFISMVPFYMRMIESRFIFDKSFPRFQNYISELRQLLCMIYDDQTPIGVSCPVPKIIDLFWFNLEFLFSMFPVTGPGCV